MPKKVNYLLLIPVLLVGMGSFFAAAGWSNSSGKVEVLDWDPYSGKMAYQEPHLIQESEPWTMHQIDPKPASGSDGVKLGDVNYDGLPDLVSGFEEGGVSRIYINPGITQVQKHWEYVELPSPGVEDAVLFDLDGNGTVDLVTASEGTSNQILFHWAPDDKGDYLDASKWQTLPLSVTDGLSAWMFIVPMDLDGQNGEDLVLGSKRKAGEKGDDKAVLGWLKSPENPRELRKWEFFPLTKAGWIMSIQILEMNGDNHPDILLSDRKFSSQTGVRWLENPGNGNIGFHQEWKSHFIGDNIAEPMFLTRADLNADGKEEILVPDLYEGLKIYIKDRLSVSGWKVQTIQYPDWAGSRGKAIAVGDMDLDGNPDLVISFEEEGKVASVPYEIYKAQGKYSVIWGSYREGPFSGKWDFKKVSDIRGRKFDLVNLIDLDGDGDLDILTNDENEEGDGLGIIWYENPHICT